MRYIHLKDLKMCLVTFHYGHHINYRFNQIRKMLRRKLKKRKSTIDGSSSLLQSLTASLGSSAQMKRGPVIKQGDISAPLIEKEILADGRYCILSRSFEVRLTSCLI